MNHLRLALVLVAVCVGAAHAQIVVGTAPTVPGLSSKGPISNPAGGVVLAEILDIPAGPHVFRAVVSKMGLGAAVLVEWRDAASASLSRKSFTIMATCARRLRVGDGNTRPHQR